MTEKREETAREGRFERYVLGITRALVIIGFGIMVGSQLAAVVAARFWPAHPPAVLWIGGILGVAGMYYLYTVLRRSRGVEGLLDK